MDVGGRARGERLVRQGRARAGHQFRPLRGEGQRHPGAPPRTPALPPAEPTTTTRLCGAGGQLRLRRRPAAPRGCHTGGGRARRNNMPCTPAAGAALLRTPDRRRSRPGAPIERHRIWRTGSLTPPAVCSPPPTRPRHLRRHGRKARSSTLAAGAAAAFRLERNSLKIRLFNHRAVQILNKSPIGSEILSNNIVKLAE